MIVITGGAGFIGSALVWRLNQKSITDILVVDHLDESEAWKNLVPLKFSGYLDRQEFITRLERGDFGNSIEAVFHMGAGSSTTEKKRRLPSGKQLPVYVADRRVARAPSGLPPDIRFERGNVRRRQPGICRQRGAPLHAAAAQYVRLFQTAV